MASAAAAPARPARGGWAPSPRAGGGARGGTGRGEGTRDAAGTRAWTRDGDEVRREGQRDDKGAGWWRDGHGQGTIGEHGWLPKGAQALAPSRHCLSCRAWLKGISDLLAETFTTTHSHEAWGHRSTQCHHPAPRRCRQPLLCTHMGHTADLINLWGCLFEQNNLRAQFALAVLTKILNLSKTPTFRTQNPCTFSQAAGSPFSAHTQVTPQTRRVSGAALLSKTTLVLSLAWQCWPKH